MNSNVHSQLAQQQISLPAPGRVRAPQGRDRDHPVDDPVGVPVRRAAAAHRRAGQDLRRQLHRRPSLRDALRRRCTPRSAPPHWPTPRTRSSQGLVQTSFRGTTLRGLLLEAYAFSKIGQIMLWGAIASFVAGRGDGACWSGWASLTLAAPSPRRRCSPPRWAPPPPDRGQTRSGLTPIRCPRRPASPARASRRGRDRTSVRDFRD